MKRFVCIVPVFFLLLSAVGTAQEKPARNAMPYYQQQSELPLSPVITLRASEGFVQYTPAGPDSMIRDIVSAVSVDTVRKFIQTMQNFVTRNAMAPNRESVVLWLKLQFLRMGYSVKLDSFLYSGIYHKSVIATLPGRTYPERICISGGHFDSASPDQLRAPGADDNASGTAAVLECARVFKLKNVSPSTTVQFMAFATEEYGLHGSKSIANLYAAQGIPVALMINHDMISYSKEPLAGARVDINYYQGAENWLATATAITKQYSSLTPVKGSLNSSGSDSYSFWQKGYPAVYFEENTFSPFYHTFADTIGNYNMPFCAEVIKASCALLLTGSNTPAQVNKLTLYDAGTGSAIKAVWSGAAATDLKHYKISVGKAAGVYDTVYYTMDSSYMVRGLQDGKKYFVAVSVVNIGGFESQQVEKSATATSTPAAPANFSLEPQMRKIFLSWNANTELDFMGYTVYRSLDSASGFIKLTSNLMTDTSYTDNSAQSGKYYYYKVTARDSAGNETGGYPLRGRVISLDKGLCIINETFPGDGTLTNPSAEQLRSFYATVFSSFRYDTLDANQLTKVTLSDLGPYSTVVWYADDLTNYSVPNQSRTEIAKYLNAGGKMLIASGILTKAFAGSVVFPANYQAGSFAYDYFKIANANYHPLARFIGAKAVAGGYGNLAVDTTKTKAANNYHITGVETFVPLSSAAPIYTYESGYDTSTSQGKLKGGVVATEYLSGNYKLVLAGFPLYYMKADQAKQFVNHVLLNKFGEPLGIGEEYSGGEIPSQYLLEQNYPNPFNPVTVIKYGVGKSEALGNRQQALAGKGEFVSLKVFDVLGREVATLVDEEQPAGSYAVSFNAAHLPSGTYLYELRAGSYHAVKKMIFLK